MLFTANSNDFKSTVFLTYGFSIHSILSVLGQSKNKLNVVCLNEKLYICV